jgi:hypothetical protein
MKKEIPQFNFVEKDFDYTFLGQWIIHNVDDYGSIKAGTVSRTCTVRSKVDFQNDCIILAAFVPERYGVENIIMDGSVGLYGKIVEKVITSNKEGQTIIDFLYIKYLKAENIQKDYVINENGFRVWQTKAEIDDLVFNKDENYTYPFYYIGTNTYSSKLVGMLIEIPINHFNHYVHMRELWYNDYKGSKEIHQSSF